MRNVGKAGGTLACLAIAQLCSGPAHGVNLATRGFDDQILKPAPLPIATDLATRPLVIVRYAIAVDPASHDEIAKRYVSGDRYYNFTTLDRADPATFDIALIETAYYGPLLARCLRHELPDNVEILLEPTSLRVASNNNVAETGPSVTVPATVVVDFFAYTSPGQFMWLESGGRTSFGDSLLPMFSVRAARDALPATRGAIAGDWYISPLLTDRDVSGDSGDARSGDRATLSELLNMPKRSPGRRPKAITAALSDTRPWRPNRYLTFHMMWFEGYAASDASVVDGNSSEFCKGAALIVRDAVAGLTKNPDTETRRLASYARQFDSAFAQRLQAGAVTTDDHERVAMLDSFYKTEMAYLKRIDSQLSHVFLDGGWGAAFRELRGKQVEIAKSARHEYMSSLWGRIAGASLGAIAGISMGASPTQVVQNARLQQGMLDARRAVTQANPQMAASMAKATDAQLAVAPVLVELEGVHQEVSAQSLQELREQLKQLWNQRIGH